MRDEYWRQHDAHLSFLSFLATHVGSITAIRGADCYLASPLMMYCAAITGRTRDSLVSTRARHSAMTGGGPGRATLYAKAA